MEPTLLEAKHKVMCTPGLRENSNDFRRARARFTCWYWRVGSQEVVVTHCRGKDTDSSGEYSKTRSSSREHSLAWSSSGEYSKTWMEQLWGILRDMEQLWGTLTGMSPPGGHNFLTNTWPRPLSSSAGTTLAKHQETRDIAPPIIRQAV